MAGLCHCRDGQPAPHGCRPHLCPPLCPFHSRRHRGRRRYGRTRYLCPSPRRAITDSVELRFRHTCQEMAKFVEPKRPQAHRFFPSTNSATLRDRLLGEIAGLPSHDRCNELGTRGPTSQKYADRRRCKAAGRWVRKEAIRAPTNRNRRTELQRVFPSFRYSFSRGWCKKCCRPACGPT